MAPSHLGKVSMLIQINELDCKICQWRIIWPVSGKIAWPSKASVDLCLV